MQVVGASSPTLVVFGASYLHQLVEVTAAIGGHTTPPFGVVVA